MGKAQIVYRWAAEARGYGKFRPVKDSSGYSHADYSCSRCTRGASIRLECPEQVAS